MKDRQSMPDTKSTDMPQHRALGVLATFIITIAFVAGYLYAKVSLYESGFISTGGQVAGATNP